MMNTQKAPEGYWLTQSSLKDERARIFMREVSCVGEIDGKYELISEQERQEWISLHKPEQPQIEIPTYPNL